MDWLIDCGVNLHLFSKLVSAIVNTLLGMLLIYFRWAKFTNAGKLNVFRYHSLESEIIFYIYFVKYAHQNVSNRGSEFKLDQNFMSYFNTFYYEPFLYKISFEFNVNLHFRFLITITILDIIRRLVF
jgi:hypothetical protein